MRNSSQPWRGDRGVLRSLGPSVGGPGLFSLPWGLLGRAEERAPVMTVVDFLPLKGWGLKKDLTLNKRKYYFLHK